MSGTLLSQDGSPLLSETGMPLLAEGGAAPSGPPGTPSFHYFAPPPTRILSWLQMCLEADPSFRRLSLRPWTYEFSNGRLFVESLPVYGSTGITDDFGNAITDDFGTQIQSDTATSPSSETGFPFGQGAFGATPF